MRTWLKLFITSFLLLTGTQLHAARLALVVGIDEYDHIEDLNKAGNDARAVSEALQNLSFAVTTLIDVDEQQFDIGFGQFVDQVRQGDEVVFFFAGHGIELDGRNWLLPSDVPNSAMASQVTLERRSISADRIITDLHRVGASVVIQILDACRDNPMNTEGRSVGGARGLTITAAPEGSFILMSAASGQIAFEGDDDDPNSIFTRVLIDFLAEPGLSLPELATQIRRDVQSEARRLGYEQRPAYLDEGAGDFSFLPVSNLESPQERNISCAAARADWSYIDGTDDRILLEEFLRVHRDCMLYTRLAERQLGSLEEPELQNFDDWDALAEVTDPRLRQNVLLARNGDPDSMGYIGLAFLTGDGVDLNYELALYWNLAAAEAGAPMAMTSLGTMYLGGLGVEQSDTEALRWFQAGAEAGDAMAMNSLGHMYQQGIGVEQNYSEAVRWYAAGVEAGHTDSVFRLGLLHAMGLGVEQDFATAFILIASAATRRHADAMYQLSYMFAQGQGTPQNFSEARLWFRRAYQAGSQAAALDLNRGGGSLSGVAWLHATPSSLRPLMRPDR